MCAGTNDDNTTHLELKTESFSPLARGSSCEAKIWRSMAVERKCCIK